MYIYAKGFGPRQNEALSLLSFVFDCIRKFIGPYNVRLLLTVYGIGLLNPLKDRLLQT